MLEERIQRKLEIFEIYQEQLGSIPGISFVLPEASFGRSNRWLTVMTPSIRSIIKRVTVGASRLFRGTQHRKSAGLEANAEAAIV